MSRVRFSWPKILGWGLALLLTALLMGFWDARARYESRLRHQIWATQAPEVSALTNSGAGPTVLFLGDSRLAYWGTPRLARWRVVNAAAGGLTTGQVRLATPRLLDEFHPDTVVLQAGMNDLKFLGLQPDMASTILSLAASNLTAIVTEASKRGCRVVVLTVWPASQPDWVRRLLWSTAIPKGVAQLNAELLKLNAPARQIRVVDLFKEAGLEPQADLFCDTLHFKPEVYQRLGPALDNVLAQIPLPPTTRQ